MKKVLTFLLIFSLGFLSVNADTTSYDVYEDTDFPYSKVSLETGCPDCGLYLQNKYVWNDFDYFYANSDYKNIFDELYNSLLSDEDVSISNINAHLSVLILANALPSSLDLELDSVYLRYSLGNAGVIYFYANGTYYHRSWNTTQGLSCNMSIGSYTYNPCNTMSFISTSSFSPFKLDITDNSNSTWLYVPTMQFSSNQPHYNNASWTFNLYDINNNLIDSISTGDSLPVLYPNFSFNPNELYNEVNLDNYNYVILSLKNYNQSDAFSTNLQVLGSIGITPIYNYGRTSKDTITGSQVQDRCNPSYSSYTPLTFYILDSDLLNHSVYAVSSCSSGSKFKYDTSIFDITYVTSSNASDPVVVIDGTSYHTIPYSDLPSSATQNEVNNYIPGQSAPVVDSNTLDQSIKGLSGNLAGIWSTFTYFTDFVGQIFASLPPALSSILISAFTISIVIGLIKLFAK